VQEVVHVVNQPLPATAACRPNIREVRQAFWHANTRQNPSTPINKPQHLAADRKPSGDLFTAGRHGEPQVGPQHLRTTLTASLLLAVMAADHRNQQHCTDNQLMHLHRSICWCSWTNRPPMVCNRFPLCHCLNGPNTPSRHMGLLLN